MSRKAAAGTETAYTVAEYLAFERSTDTKHDYTSGEVIALAGASRKHNLISGNAFAEIRRCLSVKPCEAYMSDMRVRTSPAHYVYPDVVVVCGEPRFEDEEFDTLLNPAVLIEVLSPSTEARDRGDRLHNYGSVDSVKEYLLIAQDAMRVDHYIKQSGNEWKLCSYSRPDEQVRIESLGCELSLADIYARVQFPSAAGPVTPETQPAS